MMTAGKEALDPRVRRSRAALMRAAVELVAQRGTAAVPVSEIAEAAGVTRPVIYQHFGDRESLLLAAVYDLASRELLPRLADASKSPTRRAGALALAAHFAEHRAFYRAVLTSSCAFQMTKSLTELLIPVNQELVHQTFGSDLDAQAELDFATFLTGGGAAVVNTWVVEGPEPLDPEQFADRLMRLAGAAAALLPPAASPLIRSESTTTKVQEPQP
ncbi:TetR/AcrR family transcriptional regulator [Arthrobacter sp. CDRTa11]|uniref:TetR/AcrR family transcriptional regulator n=1 Tax=Arthrobacter sp. CDRTa11 TaxID=2651199 RepID=UPI002265AA8D|nr:TetR/AcrR family transcriptional regulator [Arthrobacter sp. CDRTa11]UZX04905.1 TetR/AcrR family transcriptional regulator [Arthrobacter sp. CDRTa11]